jgi:hypothetical protein
MRIRRYITVVLLAAAFVMAVVPRAWADDAPSQEYKIKAAFLYNFLKFVDWPTGKEADPNKPITLGIIGKDPFGKAFEPVKDKKINDREVVIKRFKSVAELKKPGKEGEAELDKQSGELKKCHLLFICSSEKDGIEEILAAIKDRPVLTVADTEDFLKSGGIINFVMEEQKVHFEISDAAAKRSKLQIRSQLLRLAKKVVK